MSILGKIAPQAALKRAVARKRLEMINSGYGNYGGSNSRKSTQGWLYRGGSSKEDIERNLPTLRQRSRDLYMGGGIIGTGAIKTMRTNVVGRGLQLKCKIDYEAIGITQEKAREYEAAIQREWKIFADTPECDMQRLNNFYELQQLVMLNWLMSGDVFAILPMKKRVNVPYDLRIKLVEADMVGTPADKSEYTENITSGVKFSADGEIISYFFMKKHPLSTLSYLSADYAEVPAYGAKTGRRNVLHIMNSERIGQVRGVPFLAPVIEAIKQIGRYTDAELLAAVVSGMFTVFIERENTSDESPLGESIPLEEQVDAGDPTTVEMGPGSIIDLNDGEKAHDVNPGRPNANFEGFVTAVCKEIGAALEIPIEILLKQFDSSYSASRAALLEAWKAFKMYRKWLSDDFCQPIYEQWLSEAVAKGRVNLPGYFGDIRIQKAYTSAEWIGPAQGLLNPVQEVNAAKTRVECGFSTRDRETMEMTGGNFYQNVSELKYEGKLMKEVSEDADEQP